MAVINHFGIIMGAVCEVIQKGGVWTNADIHDALGNMPNWIIDEAIEKLEANQMIEDVSIGNCDSDIFVIPKQWTAANTRPGDGQNGE